MRGPTTLSGSLPTLLGAIVLPMIGLLASWLVPLLAHRVIEGENERRLFRHITAWLCCVIVLAINFLLLEMPFKKIFMDFGIELPRLTLAFLVTGDWINTHWYAIPSLIAACAAMLSIDASVLLFVGRRQQANTGIKLWSAVMSAIPITLIVLPAVCIVLPALKLITELSG